MALTRLGLNQSINLASNVTGTLLAKFIDWFSPNLVNAIIYPML